MLGFDSLNRLCHSFDFKEQLIFSILSIIVVDVSKQLISLNCDSQGLFFKVFNFILSRREYTSPFKIWN
jgi:hypothetical protein